jgi:hypothetical protein
MLEQVNTAALLIASIIHGGMDLLAGNSCMQSIHFMSTAQGDILSLVSYRSNIVT